LARLLPAFEEQIADFDAISLEGRVGFRSATPDYLPIVGAVPKLANDRETGRHVSSQLQLRERHAQNWPGLFITAGHGSKGLATCPLAAELLADLITGQPYCVEASVFRAIAPVRFAAKRAHRGSSSVQA